jgi:pimeloyl-ACP methyl ester carboxylesterase
MLILAWLVGVVAVLLLVRAVLLYRVQPQRSAEPFDGVAYRVGAAVVAERTSRQPRATVLCMHGFVEDLRYFSRFYADPDIQLILINSADYHVPIVDPQFRLAAWAAVPPVSEGTIEYDAMVLIQALQHLPKTRSIRVHGHSRGGAVALEAATMRPDLFREVEVVLEAPMLPRGRFRRPSSRVFNWFFPLFVTLWRRHPISNYNRHQWGRLDDMRKREVIESLPFNARRVVTMVRNLKSLAEWANRRDHSVYANLRRGVILVADNDQVLDPQTMRESAQHASPAIPTVPVDDCSHFVLFDQPQAIPALARETSEAARLRMEPAAP